MKVGAPAVFLTRFVRVFCQGFVVDLHLSTVGFGLRAEAKW
jgi:hypothetical protein